MPRPWRDEGYVPPTLSRRVDNTQALGRLQYHVVDENGPCAALAIRRIALLVRETAEARAVQHCLLRVPFPWTRVLAAATITMS